MSAAVRPVDESPVERVRREIAHDRAAGIVPIPERYRDVSVGEYADWRRAAESQYVDEHGPSRGDW